MTCIPYTARISVRACHANQALGMEAIRSILADEESVWTLAEPALDRMLVCGKCPLSLIRYSESKEAFRKSVDVLAEKISRYREYGPDPEVQAVGKKESRKKYREVHRDQIRSRAEDRRIKDRIKKLKTEEQNGKTKDD